MNKKELENHIIKNEDGIFIPLTSVNITYSSLDGISKRNYDYTIIKTAEEVYKEWKETKGVIKEKEITKEEILSKEVAELKISDANKNLIITNALETIATLKLEILDLKGGK